MGALVLTLTDFKRKPLTVVPILEHSFDLQVVLHGLHVNYILRWPKRAYSFVLTCCNKTRSGLSQAILFTCILQN